MKLKSFLTALISVFLLVNSTVASNDGSLATLSTENGFAVVTYEGKVALKVPLSPKKKVYDETFKEDQAILLANCLIIRRGVRWSITPEAVEADLGPTVEGPTELYTLAGQKKVLADTSDSTFFGANYTHPSGQWGVVLNGDDGNIDHMVLLKSDGSFQVKHLSKTFFTNSEITPVVDSDVQITYHLQYAGEGSGKLTIHSDGSYDIKSVPIRE